MDDVHSLAPVGTGILNIGGGLSGNVLLKANISRNQWGQRVEIVTPEVHALPRATIGNTQAPRYDESSPQAKNLMDIRGMKGEYYGLLEVRSDGPCIVTRQGDQVMRIDGEPETMRLWISSTGSKPLASAELTQDGGVELVDIRVNPGMDTVLALALLISVLLFAPAS